ncbi:hypothetical protein L596_018378 [Steinernema carpocapsae]|uniref:Non-specific serine/threonine protein kinase n=1 Tax=Steinernema carpocapsae TaxID=34508 RepID=A0A4V6A207_STECR|nr:hypothetical protein L596_018378 [Steinernema carpocapsae]
MERAYQSTSTGSRHNTPDTVPPPRPHERRDSKEGDELVKQLLEFIEGLKKGKRELEARIKELEAELAEYASKRTVQLKELHEARNHRETQRIELDSWRTRYSELKVQLSKAENDLLRARDLKSEISREFMNLKRTHENTEFRLKKAEERIQESIQEQKNAEMRHEETAEEARKARDELSDARSELQAQKAENARLEKSNDALAQKMWTAKEKFQETLKELNAQVEAMEKLKRAAERQRDEAIQKSTQLEQENLKLENQMHKLGLEVKQLEKSDGRLRIQIDECEAKLKAAEESKLVLMKSCETAEKDRTEAMSMYARLEHSHETILAENRRLRAEIDDWKRSDSQRLTSIEEFNSKLVVLGDEKESLEAKNAKLREMVGTLKTSIAQIDRELEKKTEDNRIIQRSKDMIAVELNQARVELQRALSDYEGLQRSMAESERGQEADNRRLREKLDSLTAELQTVRMEHQDELRQMHHKTTDLEVRHFEQLQKFSSENKENVHRAAYDFDRISELERRLVEMKTENAKLEDIAQKSIEKCEELKERASIAEQMNSKMAHNEAEARLKVTHLEREIEKLQNSQTDESSVSQVRFSDTISTMPVVHEEEEEPEEDYDDEEEDDGETIAESEADHQRETAAPIGFRYTNNMYQVKTSSYEMKKEPLDYVGVPLLRGDRLSSSTSQLEEHKPTPTKTLSKVKSSMSTSVLGTMRHDIPHRFKSSIAWKHGMCAVCVQAIPSFRYYYKCQECGMCIHRRCAVEALHTCSLPQGCEDFYLDNTLRDSPKEIDNKVVVKNGCVLMATNPDGPWSKYWVSMNGDKLSFYDSEALATFDGNCRMTISMTDDKWRIHSGTPAVRNVSKELAIEIQTKSGFLYLAVSTPRTRQLWVRALQRATNRRLFVKRRSSTVPVRNTPFLTMNYPENLSIHSTLLVEEFFLIAAQEGLYAVRNTQIQTSALMRIPGFCDVYHMEILPELDRLLIIHGPIRELLLVELGFIGHLLAGQTPRFACYPVENITNCHLMVTSKNSNRRLVYAATTDTIFVLRVNSGGGLSTLTEIKTQEPCVCLLPTATGFAFGADDFHIITIDSKFSKRAVRVDNCPSDYPIAALSISEDEILLVYYNYGVFVDLEGRRSRRDNVEWSRVPLQLVYTEPFLYVVHFESLEVLEVAPYNRGINSETLKKDRDMYKCKNAHFTGLGTKPNDVIFAIEGSDRVELHAFNAGQPILKT